MYNIAIYGSCVSRGIFDISEKGKSAFNVSEYIAKNNMYTLFSPPTHLNRFANITNPHDLDWRSRMVYYDCEKKVVDVLCNQNVDMLVIDLIDQRLGLLTDPETGSVITNSEALQWMNIPDEIPNKVPVPISVYDYWKTYNIFKQFATRIKEAYSLQQIVLVEAYPVMLYKDKNGNIVMYDEKSNNIVIRRIDMLSMQYSILKELLAGCHVLSFPHNIIGSEIHKFGLANTHFEKSYYDKMASKMINIMENKMMY